VRIVMLEDHEAVREGLSLLLARAGHEVVGQTARGTDARALVLGRRPDLLLIDLGLPEGDALALIRGLARATPMLRIVVYTASEDRGHIEAALEAGAHGIVTKEAAPAELLEGIDAVGRGRGWLDPRVERMAFGDAARDPVLTAREREVLELLASGLSPAEVSERLQVSGETIRSHVKSAMAKLGASTRSHAVALALQRAEIEPG
jgi:DNA-binding NarL/FixJ family response regulator